MKGLKPIWIYGLLAAMFFSVFFWVTNRNQSLTDLERAYINLPEDQAQSERNWRDIEFKQIAFNPDLFNPMSMIIYIDVNLLVSDFGDMKIKKFDIQARLLQTLGEGEGRGPGEALNIMDLQVDQHNRIWVTDVENSRITVFENSESWEIIEPEDVPSRVLPINGEHYVIEPRFSSSLEKRNRNGTLRTSFQNLVN
jgi:hypothetical protein